MFLNTPRKRLSATDKKEFFNTYKDLFQYDDYSSNDENTALKRHLLTADASVALDSLPNTLLALPPATTPLNSFGITSPRTQEERMMATTTGGITPRSPRSLQLEALEQTQKTVATHDKLFHHNILFSPIRNSGRNGTSPFKDREADESTALDSVRSELDLLGRAVERANQSNPYKSPRQRLAQLTLARDGPRVHRYNGPNTPASPNYAALNIDQREQPPLQPQHPEQDVVDSPRNDDMAYTSLSLHSNVTTPNSSVFPSARTMTTIDSNAPALEVDPSGAAVGLASTSMAAPFLGHGQGEAKRRTRTKNDRARQPPQLQRPPQPQRPQQPQQPQQPRRPGPMTNLYNGQGPHPLGVVSQLNPTGILPPSGDRFVNPQSRKSPVRSGKRTYTNQEKRGVGYGGIESGAAGYMGNNILRPGRAYVPEPTGSTADMNHLLFKRHAPGMSGGFNPDIAPKKRLNLAQCMDVHTEEDRQRVLNKLNKLLYKTTGKAFTGYVHEIPLAVMRRMGLGKGMKTLKQRKRLLSNLLDADQVQYAKDKKTRVAIDFGLNRYPFEIL
jgi:hypothetical protein